jgi:hypothetical protein
VNACRRDVFSKLPGANEEVVRSKIVKQLGWHEMNLTKIGEPRLGSGEESLLDLPTGVRVSLNAMTFDQIDIVPCRLSEPMLSIRRYADDSAILDQAAVCCHCWFAVWGVTHSY